jgi:riboflavin kinase / FMN adenylyltransferase
VVNGVIQGLENLKNKGYVVTQGTFDGVHLGHQTVLQQVTREAQNQGLPSMLITYHPHPRSIVQPKEWKQEILSSIEEKTERVLAQGIDHVLILPFTETISQLSPEAFIQEILIEKIGMKSIIIGYDHRFGKNRSGNFETLLAAGSKGHFNVIEIQANAIDDIAISSTRIRSCLREGRIREANFLLGKPYPISGEVIQGLQNGRKLGFPTANIKPEDPYKLIPKSGVYAAITYLENTPYKTVVNIGVRPTFEGTNLSIEAHLIDYTGDLYGRRIQIEMHDFIRNERKFESLDGLKVQIQKDVQHALEQFSHI